MQKMKIDKKNITKEEINQIANRFANGDVEAFNILYGLYSRNVYRFCQRMLVNVDVAKDAFQETFVKIYECRASYNGNSFQSWLFTIARRTCINHIRKRKTMTSIQNIDVSFQPKRYLDIGIKEHIEKKLEQLPIALKEAFILRDMEDLSYDQIAEILQIDMSLVKVRVHRARLKLKELLKPLLKEINEAI